MNVIFWNAFLHANAAADLLVVDEAHNLDDKVRSATTERFGQGMLFGMIKSAFYGLRSFDQSSVSREKREAESSIIAFYNCLKTQVQKQINEADQDMRYADRFFFDQNGSAVELLTEMNAAIHNLSSSIQIYSSMDFRNNRSFAASDDLDAVSESLSELLDQIDDIVKLLGRETLATRTRGQTKGRSGSSSTNFQQTGRDLMTIDEVRKLDTHKAILFIRGEDPVLDKKYNIKRHPNIKLTTDGKAKPYIHKPQGAPDYALPDLPYAFRSLDDYDFIDTEDTEHESEQEEPLETDGAE